MSDPWAEILADPEAVARIDAGLADLAAGRKVLWEDIRENPDADDGKTTHEENQP